jgi:hypothetical protein
LHGGSGFDVDLGDAIGYDDRVRDRGFSPTRHGRGGHAFDEQGSCFGMGVVAMPLMNKVLASTATWVTTTRPLGIDPAILR